MKAGLLAFAALSAVASAQPHRRHLQLHEQRDVVVVETAYATQVEYATVTAPAVIVYVDSNGKPISAPQENAPPAAAPAAAPEAPVVAPVVNNAAVQVGGNGVQEQPKQPDVPAPSPDPVYVPPVVASPSPPAPVAEQPYVPPAAPSPATVPSTGSSGVGITYSPYNADNSCKTDKQVKQDIDALDGTHKLIRLYGADCNQIENVLAAAKPHGYKLFLGIYDITSVDAANPITELAKLILAAKNDWAYVDTVSVGNEGINEGKYSVAQIGVAVAAVKTALTLVGYTGPVVTVDTFVAIINNPAMCNIGDYVAANCHAFFDGGVTGDGAGPFVLSQAQRVSAACGGKKTVITESGWPSQGTTNQKAIASPAEQSAAVASLQKSFSSNLILFNAYNDGWKKDTAATFNAEKHWGIYGNHPSAY